MRFEFVIKRQFGTHLLEKTFNDHIFLSYLSEQILAFTVTRQVYW